MKPNKQKVLKATISALIVAAYLSLFPLCLYLHSILGDYYPIFAIVILSIGAWILVYSAL